MREIYGFLRPASRLANLFGHPLQVRTQVLVQKAKETSLFWECVLVRSFALTAGIDPFVHPYERSEMIATREEFLKHLPVVECFFGGGRIQWVQLISHGHGFICNQPRRVPC